MVVLVELALSQEHIKYTPIFREIPPERHCEQL